MKLSLLVVPVVRLCRPRSGPQRSAPQRSGPQRSGRLRYLGDSRRIRFHEQKKAGSDLGA